MTQEDDELKKLEEELKNLEDKSDYESPPSQDKDTLYKFFREILNLQKTTRVGKLDKNELGGTKLGVRHYMDIAAYARAEGLNIVSDYLVNKSQILTETSMSKDGFWAQLFVTQIKKEQKLKEPSKESKKWWERKQKDEESE